MADVTLNTKQYLILMRSVAAAMVLDEHVSAIRGDELDADLAQIWEDMMDKTEDFGMTFPPEGEEEDHWSDIMFSDADDNLHAVVDDEFLPLLASRLAERDHTAGCTKVEGEHDETCFSDVEKLAEKWLEKLEEGGVGQLV